MFLIGIVFLYDMGFIRRVIVSFIALIVIIVVLVVLFNLFIIAIIGGILIAIVAIIVGLFKRMQRTKFEKTMKESAAERKAASVKKVVDVEYKVKDKAKEKVTVESKE